MSTSNETCGPLIMWAFPTVKRKKFCTQNIFLRKPLSGNAGAFDRSMQHHLM